MAESEKISGEGIRKLFEELLQRKTRLKLTLMDTGYENFTCVTGLPGPNNDPLFSINTPEGFKAALADIDVGLIRFEFTGKDKIKYAFTTSGDSLAGNQIYIKFPEEVQREQRRKLFRIKAPDGTKLCFNVQLSPQELDVIDMSLGGSLAAVVQTDKHILKNPAFSDSNVLHDIELVFPAEISRQPIKIKTAQIKRMKKNPETRRYEMAFEFNKISKRDERLLTELIYRLQRQYLRQRLPLDV